MKTVIEMAQDVEFEFGFKWCVNFIELERFATLVAAAEREACARELESLSLAHPGRADLTMDQCIAAIRARGEG